MKFSNKIDVVKKFVALALIAVVVAMALPAMAQRGQDEFSVPRSVWLVPLQNINGGAAFTTSTNMAIDTRGYFGIAKLDVFAETNSGTTGGTLTMTLQTSPDLTNWTILSNFVALVTNLTSYVITNAANTNIYTTNSFILPGTQKTPTAATAGLAAVPYLVPPQYTNGAAMTINPGNAVELGFSIEDLPNRYFRAYFTPGGTATNYTVGAVLTTPVPTYYGGY